MITCFSATGSNKYVAHRIAENPQDRLLSSDDSIKTRAYEATLNENESLGFVTPAYFWGLPSIVANFIDKMHLKTAWRIIHTMCLSTVLLPAQRTLLWRSF